MNRRNHRKAFHKNSVHADCSLRIFFHEDYFVINGSISVFFQQENTEKTSKFRSYTGSGINDDGWPLCIHGKVVIHLTELDPEIRPATGTSSILRPGDFYFHISRPSLVNPSLVLCLKLRTLSGELIEIRIPPTHLNMAFSHKWFEETIFHSSSDARLLGALEFCVVSFERSIDRIELQLLTSGWQQQSSFNSSASASISSISSSFNSNEINSITSHGEILSAPGVLDSDCKCLCRVTAKSSGHNNPTSRCDTTTPGKFRNSYILAGGKCTNRCFPNHFREDVKFFLGAD